MSLNKYSCFPEIKNFLKVYEAFTMICITIKTFVRRKKAQFSRVINFYSYTSHVYFLILLQFWELGKNINGVTCGVYFHVCNGYYFHSPRKLIYLPKNKISHKYILLHNSHESLEFIWSCFCSEVNRLWQAEYKWTLRK